MDAETRALLEEAERFDICGRGSCGHGVAVHDDLTRALAACVRSLSEQIEALTAIPDLQGTFACPICGREKPHPQAAHREDRSRRDGPWCGKARVASPSAGDALGILDGIKATFNAYVPPGTREPWREDFDKVRATIERLAAELDEARDARDTSEALAVAARAHYALVADAFAAARSDGPEHLASIARETRADLARVTRERDEKSAHVDKLQSKLAELARKVDCILAARARDREQTDSAFRAGRDGVGSMLDWQNPEGTGPYHEWFKRGRASRSHAQRAASTTPAEVEALRAERDALRERLAMATGFEAGDVWISRSTQHDGGKCWHAHRGGEELRIDGTWITVAPGASIGDGAECFPSADAAFAALAATGEIK